jgi:hypothetical protein
LYLLGESIAVYFYNHACRPCNISERTVPIEQQAIFADRTCLTEISC